MTGRTPNHATGQGKSQPIWKRVFAALLAIAVTSAFCFAFWSLRELRKNARLASRRPHCITWVTEGYSRDHDGMFPPLSPTAGRLTFAEGAEKPNVTDSGRRDLICEFDAQDGRDVVTGAPIDDWSYFYLGYLIEDQEQLELFSAAYKRIVAAGGDFSNDIKVPPGQGNCGTDTIYRLRDPEKLVKLLPCLKGRLGEIPLVIEWPENHRGPVAKVGVSRWSKGRGLEPQRTQREQLKVFLLSGSGLRDLQFRLTRPIRTDRWLSASLLAISLDVGGLLVHCVSIADAGIAVLQALDVWEGSIPNWGDVRTHGQTRGNEVT